MKEQIIKNFSAPFPNDGNIGNNYYASKFLNNSLQKFIFETMIYNKLVLNIKNHKYCTFTI